MKRTNIIIGFLSYALLALILIVCGWWLAALLLLLIYGIVLLLYKRNKKAQWLIDGDPSDKETLDTLIAQYGQPDDVVVIDASRANEPFGVILIYSSAVSSSPQASASPSTALRASRPRILPRPIPLDNIRSSSTPMTNSWARCTSTQAMMSASPQRPPHKSCMR